MSGDYSRHTFDPKKHHSGILMQQGRVQLDADWNEQIEILNRRWRAETHDLIGRCCVPKTTPDAFKIEISNGVVTIGRGRIYVDGLLAENQGERPLEFDNVLSEERGTLPVSYNKQPYYHPDPNAIPESGGPYLLYLDVWQREVTFLQEPDIIEKAVGIDTTTRLQTVWQVKVLPDVGPEVTCKTPSDQIRNWPDVIRPSAGRLTTEAVGVPSTQDPCKIPPSGGYRGLENRLYRVEIHDQGPIGSATFKWSRDNATVATAITAIPNLDQIIVASVGKDSLLRFNPGDWIEITDDWLEFAGLSGEMRKILSVDDATRTIILNSALSAGKFPTDGQGQTDTDRHTRILRWDQKGQVHDTNGNLIVDLNTPGSTGVIPVPASGSSIILEDGVQVTFHTIMSSGGFRSGNYWSFAARTIDASVEQLQLAPPRAIHHHYCRLALVNWKEDGTAEITDCRNEFKSLCELSKVVNNGCCTFTVAPGENIQQALDSLPPEGGCVCLKKGDHLIEDMLRIEKSNVLLHGECLGVRVIRSNGPNLLSVYGNNVRISRIQFELENNTANVAPEPILELARCKNVSVVDSTFGAKISNNVVGIEIYVCTDLQLSQCRITNVQFGVWVTGDSTRLRIEENSISATSDPFPKSDEGAIGLYLEDIYIDDAARDVSQIKCNNIVGFLVGIADREPFKGTQSSGAYGISIIQNQISRFNLESFDSDDKYYAIDIAAKSCFISNNCITYRSKSYGGIRSSGSRSCLEGNWLSYYGSTNGGTDTAIGILQSNDDYQLQGGRIQNNHLIGPQHGIVIINMNNCEVVDNQIEGSKEELVVMAIMFVESDHSRISGNRISKAMLAVSGVGGSSNTITDNKLLGCTAGMTLFYQTALEITQNNIESPSAWGIASLESLGKCSITENRLTSCGYQMRELTFGIGVSQHYGELHIESNEVMDTGISPDGEQASLIAYGIWVDLILECRIQSNIVTYSSNSTIDVGAEHRALLARGFLEYEISLARQKLIFGFPIQILGNKFIGPGKSALVEIQQQKINDNVYNRFERVFFNNNYCAHLTSLQLNENQATLLLHGRSAIVQANHFKGLIPSVNFQTNEEIYLGNIALQGPLNFNGKPTPDTNFNYP